MVERVYSTMGCPVDNWAPIGDMIYDIYTWDNGNYNKIEKFIDGVQDYIDTEELPRNHCWYFMYFSNKFATITEEEAMSTVGKIIYRVQVINEHIVMQRYKNYLRRRW